ncbi:MAG: universal stress protein [Thermodesulfobacteriota bacterium]
MRVLFKRIICATDFSDLSNRAIPFALSLTREFGAKLYFCHVIGLPSTAIYGEILLDPTEQQDKAVRFVHEQLGRLVDPHQTDWEALISTGHTADEISRMAEMKSADMVIAATHGRSGLKRFLLGSVTERLMRILPCPLLVIPEPAADAPDAADRPLRFQRILIGCDFSADAEQAIRYGLSLAQEFQSELYLVHVIEKPAYPIPGDHAAGTENDFESVMRNHLMEKLAALIPPEATNWCSPKMVLLEGPPDEELTRYAVSEHIDLIVLGVRGQGLVEKLFVGSTTDRVVRRAPCPVLSVCPKAQEAT